MVESRPAWIHDGALADSWAPGSSQCHETIIFFVVIVSEVYGRATQILPLQILWRTQLVIVFIHFFTISQQYLLLHLIKLL